MLAQLRKEHFKFIADDPVRPHLTTEWRMQHPREVYALYEDKYAQYDELLTEDPLAIICVAYTDVVPFGCSIYSVFPYPLKLTLILLTLPS